MKNVLPVIITIVLGILAIPAIPFFALFLLTHNSLSKWIGDINGENIIDNIADNEHY